MGILGSYRGLFILMDWTRNDFWEYIDETQDVILQSVSNAVRAHNGIYTVSGTVYTGRFDKQSDLAWERPNSLDTSPSKVRYDGTVESRKWVRVPGVEMKDFTITEDEIQTWYHSKRGSRIGDTTGIIT